MSNTIVVYTDEPPTVEIDSTVPVAYIRFNHREVASTREVESDDVIITVDLDSSDRVIGVELVGVEQFNIAELAERAHIIGIPDEFLRRTHYVPATSMI
jgi:uncharacterized protein YuzE